MRNNCSAVIVEALGAGKKSPVCLTISGVTCRSSIAVMGGGSMVGLRAENSKKTGAKGGETYEITIEVDTEPRTGNVPDDLVLALKQDPEAKVFFDSMSYMCWLLRTLKPPKRDLGELKRRWK